MTDPPATAVPALNPHALRSKPSGIRRIADLAAAGGPRGARGGTGHRGAPDFDTPPAIKRAAIRALDAGHVHYTPNAGIAPLRAAIADDLARRYGAQLRGDEVVVTVGACEALTLALMATLAPGSEVVVPTPCWPNYLQTPVLLGARVRQVPMDGAAGFAFDPDAVLGALGPDTRAIVLNSPNNPSGAVAGRDELAALLAGARRRGVWLIVDEIYHDLVFDDARHGVWEVARPDDPLIYVNGFSKSYAMTGWRIGYAVARGEAAATMARIHQALVTSVTSFVQHAAIDALAERAAVETMRSTYASRRNRVGPRLAAAGLSFPTPAGGFYVFPRVPAGWQDGDRFAEDMLGEHGVALVPGSVFGDAHADRFRLCFACADDLLDEGIGVLTAVVAGAPKPPCSEAP